MRIALSVSQFGRNTALGGAAFEPGIGFDGIFLRCASESTSNSPRSPNAAICADEINPSIFGFEICAPLVTDAGLRLAISPLGEAVATSPLLPRIITVHHGTRGSPADITRAVIERCGQYASNTNAPLMLEGAGVVASSRELWQILDALPRQQFGACLNSRAALAAGDSLSLSVKRLASRLRVVRVPLDALSLESPPPASRDALDVDYLTDLLRGVAFQGWILVDCALAGRQAAADDDAATLNAAAQRIRASWKRPPIVLSAYKGDKHAPRFAEPLPENAE